MHITCADVSVPWEIAAYLSCLSSSSSNRMEPLQLWIKNNLHRNTSPLVTTWRSLERLTFLQLDEPYPALYETPKFITILIAVCCFCILSQINPIHNLPPYSFMVHFTLPFPSAFTTKTVYSHLSTSMHVTSPHSHLTFHDLSPEYLVRSATHETPQCAISPSSLLLPPS